METARESETMTKTELLTVAAKITGGDVKGMTLDEIKRLMTVMQYITDICLNELQDRGELAEHEGRVVVPYVCDHMVQTILTGRR